MPNRCSAPGCRSNYSGEPYTPVFKIPNGPPDRVAQWKRALCRDNIDEIQNIYVCIKHFRDEDVETHFAIPQQDGSIKKVKRDILKLHQAAIPQFLPGCPSYLSTHSLKPTRLDSSVKDRHLLEVALKLSMEQQQLDNEKFKVSSFSDLQFKLNSLVVPKHWLLWTSEASTLHLIRPTSTSHINGAPSIQCSLTIDESLYTKGFYDSNRISLSIKQIQDIRDIEILCGEISLYRVDNPLQEDSNPLYKQYLVSATKQLHLAVDELTKSEQLLHDTLEGNTHLPSLQFVLCQLENVLRHKKHRTYNIRTIIVALKCQLISPACYHYLQASDSLSLPHHATLQRLYSKIGLDSEFTCFLRRATNNFSKSERNVIIQMDEVHVQSDLTYKGGRIIGSSEKSTDSAKTILAFMVSSLRKKWSTIVRLLPCSNSSATELFPTIVNVIQDVENCGLFVRVICTDNYPMNVNIFKLFSPTHTLEPIVPHILDSDRSLVLLFDFVHILKSIRNNWVNQKDNNRSFGYPNFEDFTTTNFASFEHIRSLYKADQHSLAKLAPRLTAKACWPSSLERQNVSLALRIFDNSTSSALKVQILTPSLHNTYCQTAEFIDIICDIWKIFNVNTPYKGIRLNEPQSNPLVLSDPRFAFLSRVVDWLEKWRELPNKAGKLTPQTFTSFRHSCNALPYIVNQLTQDCDFSYVLSSFLQNDPLEHHFGIYRMMSGAQYHISYCQILESERRIKLSSILKLFYSPDLSEELSIKEFISSFSNFSASDSSMLHVPENLISSIENYSNIEVATPTLQALAFIAGYTVHGYFKKSNRCDTCLCFLTEDKEMDIVDSPESVYKLLQVMDRGGLKWPSNHVFEVIVTMWKIFSSIELQPQLFLDLIKGPSRHLLITLTLRIIEDEESQCWRNTCPKCNLTGWDILKKLLTVSANCMLSNKVKNMNALHKFQADNSRKFKKFKSI